MFATSRAKVEHRIFFVKITNRYMEGEQFFLCRRFDGSSVKIEGEKTLYLSVWEKFLFTVTNVCVWLVKYLF